ncbi:T9SS type A sorting domain-containing protein [Algoriphagus sp.]|uniref:T9SS type A sorting domain-containing protein n=1 Tax=Algoriphagus sp. TaxID=1872435 RepID=UPI003F6ED9A9
MVSLVVSNYANAVEIVITGETTVSESNAFRVEVFDHAEQMVKSGESKEGKVLLDTRGLRPGSYFLHIYYGKEVIREQILIQ